ncbi:hypothetical protein SAMN04489712_112222 [Thermomonospora echinospora]|uniref:Uncharacterized protein n=1 Tax=Thermomonospora echinospora TaxID=1992 RepID=A0A1H6D2E6_9ACTN|nr:hypothetical protein [Thermomonospora echinospora]SEG79482.1 hypothetical protein SAMN04489712_112222 [Thermomonospora echinospora]
MSTDVVALTNDRPDVGAVLDELAARLRLAVNAQAGACRVYDEAGRLVVFVPAPVLVTVAGEVERLLGERAAPPVWWVDIRAAADLDDAARVALACADELVARHGGAVWSGASR